MFLRERVFAGKGELKADTVLKNCRIVNVNTKEILKGDIAISSGFISGIGDVDDLIGVKTEILDLKKSFVCPGLIDGHVHFESSMVTLTQFAKQSIIHGTTGIVIDPHEVANILGIKVSNLSCMRQKGCLSMFLSRFRHACLPVLLKHQGQNWVFRRLKSSLIRNSLSDSGR